MNINFKNWNIDKSNLIDYRTPDWNEDEFYLTSDNKYGVFIYNINEFRMNSYGGNFAIYNNLNSKNQIINLSKTGIWCYNLKTFSYWEKSDCLIFRKLSSPNIPFLIIKPSEKMFTIINWDYTSIYYELQEIEKDVLKSVAINPNILDEITLNRKNEIFDLNFLDWKKL